MVTAAARIHRFWTISRIGAREKAAH